jgi:hypothetical protein
MQRMVLAAALILAGAFSAQLLRRLENATKPVAVRYGEGRGARGRGRGKNPALPHGFLRNLVALTRRPPRPA